MRIVSDNDNDPSDIILATSSDGLDWTVADYELWNNGHDPTVLRLADGRIACIFAYLTDDLRVAFSVDGLTWGEAEILDLRESDGSPATTIYGDVDLFATPQGAVRLMSNHSDGITSYLPVVP